MTTPEKKKVKCNFPPPPPGNKRGVKLKDAGVRQQAYEQYCAHIASGSPKEAFFFDHPTHSVSWDTMEKYIAEHPNEFAPIKMKQAKAKRYQVWMEHGSKLMTGRYKGGSPTVWTVIMRNIFRDIGWDKEQIAQDSKTHVERLAQSIRSDVIGEAAESDSTIEQED
jgi:hypothetical protein